MQHAVALVEPVPWTPGLAGEYPGQRSFIRLGDGQGVPMYFCWCPPPSNPEPESRTGFFSGLLGKPKTENPPGFWLAQHPVNQAQWQAVMRKNPSQKGKGDNFPVDSISWNDAWKFCELAGLRFPTEEEWEYACRAGRKGEYGVGSGQGLNSQLANFGGISPDGSGAEAFEWLYREKTMPEGSFAPNDWGLHDMHGQLWEWCEDELKAGARALRGGSWHYGGQYARASYRFGFEPVSSYYYFGFRPCPSSTSKPGGSRGAGQGVK